MYVYLSSLALHVCAHACWELNSGSQLPTLSSPQEYGETGAMCCHREQCSGPRVEQAEFQHICLSHCVRCVCVEFGFQSVCRTKVRQAMFWEASGCWHSRTWVHFPDPGSGAPQQQDHSGSPRAAAQKELL